MTVFKGQCPAQWVMFSETHAIIAPMELVFSKEFVFINSTCMWPRKKVRRPKKQKLVVESPDDVAQSETLLVLKTLTK
jgi:hypothetical protein